MKTPRLTNPELVKAIRTTLTDDVKVKFDADTLHRTKQWRGELWQLMNEVERRLCPQPPVYDDWDHAGKPPEQEG